MSAFFFFNDTATTEIYTLSYTTLFRSGGNTGTDPAYNSQVASNLAKIGIKLDLKQLNGSAIYAKILDPANKVPIALTDRKSTRLNSSHDQISYAVFCLKKKTNHIVAML